VKIALDIRIGESYFSNKKFPNNLDRDKMSQKES
jgi:hypothetical protein